MGIHCRARPTIASLLVLFERCIHGIDKAISTRKPNEIFNDFAISREPIDEIDSNFFYFNGMDLKITRLDPIARRLPKLEPNERANYHFLVFKLNNFFF